MKSSDRGHYYYDVADGNKRYNGVWRHAEWVPQTLTPAAPRSDLCISFAIPSGRRLATWPRPYDQGTSRWSAAGVNTFNSAGQPIGPETGEITTDNSDIASWFSCGYALLHSDKSVTDRSDDVLQPTATGKSRAWGFLNGAPDLWTYITNEWDYREDSGEESIMYGTWNFEDPTRFTSLCQQDQYYGTWEMKNGESINYTLVHAFGGAGTQRAREAGVE